MEVRPIFSVSEEQSRLQNFMDTCHRKGKLYVFFLEIAEKVVYDIVHQRQQVPVNGKAMYLYLQDWFRNCDQGGYAEKISKSEFLLDYQRRQLLPGNGEINLEDLDFTMYMKILKLLGGSANTVLIDYMTNLRNHLCHVSFTSLERGMSHRDFTNELNLMEFYFKKYGVDKKLVDMCKRDILYRT